MSGRNSTPILFKFSMDNDRAAFENPDSLSSSKHPFTVRVSNPNELLSTKSSNSEDIERSGSEL